jgi:hypothetical protein
MLADHLASIVAQGWVGDFYDEIRRVWSLLVGANGGDGTARIPRPGRACPECGGVTITPSWGSSKRPARLRAGSAKARRRPAGVGGMTARVMITWDGTFDDSRFPLAAGRGPVRPDPIGPGGPAPTGCE